MGRRMRETVLVTGGAGYVGSHAVAELIAGGYHVVVFDNLRQGHRAAVVDGAELVIGDLADRGAVEGLFAARRFDAVMHFAANSLVGESMRKPFRYLGDNVANAVTLIEAAVAHGVRKFVFSSSCAIFGPAGRAPIDESTAVDPRNPYGESKSLVERILHWAGEIHGLRHACLRYFNAAGAHPQILLGEDHDPETHLIPLALQAALGQRPYLEIYGDDYPTPDGTCIRDYVHVCDLADAHVRVLGALDERSCHYNLGTGRGHSVREILAAVKRVTGIDVPVRRGARRPGDPPVLVAAPGRIMRELDWRPRFASIDEIVATAWAWHRARPHGYPAAAAA